MRHVGSSFLTRVWNCTPWKGWWVAREVLRNVHICTPQLTVVCASFYSIYDYIGCVLELKNVQMREEGVPFRLGMCVCVCLCVLVIQLRLILCDPMDCSPSGSFVHGIFQTTTLEWVAITFSRGSSQPRGRTRVSCIAGRFFTIWATMEATVYYWGATTLWLQDLQTNAMLN